MRSKIIIKLIVTAVLFLIIALLKRYELMFYIPFFAGGVLGVLVPDLDHLVYIYFLRPHELSSQRVASKINQSDYSGAVDILKRTNFEREHLIFHSVLFQLIFVVFAFWVLTSAGSLFANGLVLGVMAHLVIDQLEDLQQRGNLDNWFREPFSLSLTREKTLAYWAVMILLVAVFGLFF